MQIIDKQTFFYLVAENVHFHDFAIRTKEKESGIKKLSNHIQIV